MLLQDIKCLQTLAMVLAMSYFGYIYAPRKRSPIIRVTSTLELVGSYVIAEVEANEEEYETFWIILLGSSIFRRLYQGRGLK